MIRAGLIRNVRSHRNRGDVDRALPEGVRLLPAPDDPEELRSGLADFAAAGVDLVVIDGGDGTIREVITRLPEAYGGRAPTLAILPNGKTNALALDIGTPLGTTLEQILAAAAANGPAKSRTCLEIVRAGAKAAELRGFLFGMGAFTRATELAQRNHGLGLFDGAAIAVTLAGGAAGTFLGGRGNPWRRGEAASVGGEAPRQWFLVMATALKRLPLSLKPFGAPCEGLKVLSVAAPPKGLLGGLYPILRGREAANLDYRRDNPKSFDLAFDSGFVLDGERYPGGALTVREGPRLDFVIP